ncbi:14041_t:CDS:10 [Entrophospora sp. SA101]|nr:14041_t:CDS:10 [Entrophospora sp. SA101]
MSSSSNVALDATIKTNQTTPYANSIKEYFSNKGYVFYIGLGLTTVVLTGVGLYFLQAPKPPKPKSTRSTSRRKVQKTNKSSGKNESTETTRNREEDAEAEEYERYTIDQINALPKEKRVTASQLLKVRGNTAFGKGNYEKAIKLYTQALAFHQDPIFYGNRAACYFSKKEFQKTIEDCNSSLEMDPYYAVKAIERLLKKLATIKTQEIMQARPKRLPSPALISLHLETFKKATFEVINTQPVISQEDKTGDNYFNDAQEFLLQQKYYDALEAFDKAIKLKCEHLDYAYNMRGTFAYLLGDIEDALGYFDKALQLSPNYVQIYIKRATIYMEQNKPFQECLEEFSKAIEIDKDDPDIYYHRGQVYFLNNEFSKAIEDYERRIELDPEFVFAYVQLALCKYKTKGIVDAIKVCEDAIRKFSDSAEIYNYYGELLVESGDITSGMEKFDKAIEYTKGKFVLPLINKAMLYLHPNSTNNFNAAEDHCKRALEIDPDSDLANLIMGEVLLTKNDWERALQYFEKYQEFPRTEHELIVVQEYIEAAKSRIAFKKKYPQGSYHPSVGETKSVNKPTGKKPKAVNREDSSNLRKLINELSSTEKLSQFTGRDYRRDKIDRAESRNDVTNRKDNGKEGSRALIKEIWKQIPEEITDVALRKAMKIYNNMLFTEIKK